MSSSQAVPRGAWPAAGLVAGLLGLAVSHGVAGLLGLRSSPPLAVAEAVIELTPGPVGDRAIALLGGLDKPLLVTVVLVVALLALAWAGALAERSWWEPMLVHLALGGVAAVAILTRFDGDPLGLLAVFAGVVTWLVGLSFLTDPLRAASRADHVPGHTRRSFLLRVGIGAAVTIAMAALGERYSRQRARVEQARRLLKLAVGSPRPPDGVRLDLPGLEPWRTPNEDFYQVHTAIVLPTIDPLEWRLRVHGMVENELVLTYQDLLDSRISEDWMTLCCVSNEVGGPLVGNAWWSGVPLRRILGQAGVSPDADAVLQTSHDGWTCGTPLAALTDDRNAMLAIAMNGEPLPVEHGFPVRTIVPGLYGYVSATKWVVDLEVTRFADIEAYWTGKGWAEQAPVRLASRIEVPADGDELPVGTVRVGGHAWAQHTGVAGVEVALDGGPWVPAQLGRVPNEDTWVQWAATIELAEGDHELRVRATSRDGEVQTGVERDVRPDGATGWHTVAFSASAPD